MATREFDVLVAGGGTGRDVVLAAEARGLTVALVERGPLGGTCHNRGCMPSKMLIRSADLADASRAAAQFGVQTRIESIDFQAIVQNVFATLDEETDERETELRASDLVTFYRQEGRFVGPNVMAVGDDTIVAKKVIIAGGSRPSVPPITGLDRVPYLTSDEALRLAEQPQRLAIIGGGYIACELGNFFGALGTDVTLINIAERLLEREDREIADWFTRAFEAKHRVLLNAQIDRIAQGDGEIEVHLHERDEPIRADQLLVATGRRSNSDIWNVAATGAHLDERGLIKVNEYMETTVDGIWALGDIAGVMPLKHVAVREAQHVVRNALSGERSAMDYRTIPHAVFSSPQVAAVGKTEEELRDDGTAYKVGRWRFKDTGMGMALREDGLVKVLAGPAEEIFGCHIVGPNASILIQEVVVAMHTSGTLDAIIGAVHAHPTLPQVVEEACKAAAAAELA